MDNRIHITYRYPECGCFVYEATIECCGRTFTHIKRIESDNIYNGFIYALLSLNNSFNINKMEKFCYLPENKDLQEFPINDIYLNNCYSLLYEYFDDVLIN